MTTGMVAVRSSEESTWRRTLCPYCGAQFLRLESADDEEAIECPRCHRRFAPEEEEYVDPEDI